MDLPGRTLTHRRDFLAGTLLLGTGASYAGYTVSQPRDPLERAVQILNKAAASDILWRAPGPNRRLLWLPHLHSVALHVERNSVPLATKLFGPRTRTTTPFVLASISKPVTAAAVMLLVDSRDLSLTDHVSRFIPEFSGHRRDAVTVEQLLTHTSGLPDGFPDLMPLLRRETSYRDVVEYTCNMAPRFEPGTQFCYSNLGMLLAAEAVERITTLPFRRFLRQFVFEPLGMQDTSLGLGGRNFEDTAFSHDALRITAFDRYWSDFGAPWNGVHSTATDLTKFLKVFLTPGERLLSRDSALTMIRNHTAGLYETLPRGRLKRAEARLGLSVVDRIDAPRWGLGWILAGSAFGRYCSPQTFGHHGLTGTLAWADPRSQTTFALLTTRPITNFDDGLMGLISDLVSEATQG